MQAESDKVMALASELCRAVYALANRHGLTFDDAVEILVRTRTGPAAQR
jgi:hypothetical protein